MSRYDILFIKQAIYVAWIGAEGYPHRMNSPTSPLPTRSESMVISELPRESFLGRNRVPLSWGIIGILLLKEAVSGGHPFQRIEPYTPATIVGVSMILLGVFLRTWANGILHKNRVLTTAGPYQFVRHPLYAMEYARRVPSLLPRIPTKRVSFTDWHFDRWVKNREHKTLLATLAMLACLEAYQLMR